MDLEKNEPNASLMVLGASKVVLMTFLRVGSLAPMDGTNWMSHGTCGSFPQSPKTGHDHLVPLTDPLKDLLDSLRKVTGEGEFVFASHRGRTTTHINPYSINQHFIRMGYKGVQTAHGLRRTALTAGQDVLGFSAETIQRQLSHAIGDKVRQTYDDSTLLKERKKLMIAWCDALLSQGLKI